MLIVLSVALSKSVQQVFILRSFALKLKLCENLSGNQHSSHITSM